MNKFTALGLAITASTEPNKLIIVVLARRREAQGAAETLANLDLTKRSLQQVRLAAGSQEIRYENGSRILIRTAHQSLRGYAPDLIFVDEDIPRHYLTLTQWDRWQDDALPGLATGGELILG